MAIRERSAQSMPPGNRTDFAGGNTCGATSSFPAYNEASSLLKRT